MIDLRRRGKEDDWSRHPKLLALSLWATSLDSKGQPVAYGTVAVVPDLEHRVRPDSYQQETTDEHGTSSREGLTPGAMWCWRSKSYRKTYAGEFLKTYAEKGEKVELREGTRKSVTPKIIPADTPRCQSGSPSALL